MSTNRFVVIEGIDGSGKTAIGKEVASLLQWKYLKTPPEAYSPIRKFYEEDRLPFARFCFYLGAVYESAMQIKDILLTQSVICDRYLLSLILYHEELCAKPLKNYIDLTDFIQPDLNIILQVSPSQAYKRLSERSLNTDFDRRLEEDRNLMERLESAFLRAHERFSNCIYVKNEEKTINEVASYIIQSIQNKFESCV